MLYEVITWVTASFFNAQSKALMDEVDAPAESEADAVSIVGAGGGNVTQSYGNIVITSYSIHYTKLYEYRQFGGSPS